LRDRTASVSLATLIVAIVSEHPSSNGHAAGMTREVLKTIILVLREAGSESSAVAESPLPARMAAPTLLTALPCRLEFGAGFNNFLETPLLLPSALQERVSFLAYRLTTDTVITPSSQTCLSRYAIFLSVRSSTSNMARDSYS
jgi:hypothetical protein